MYRFIPALLLSVVLGFASDSDRDFSGKWLLDPAASNTRALASVDQSLNVSQGDAGLLVSTDAVKWSFALDGSETRKRIGDESRNSVTKWEGSALIINTLVSGPQEYTVMDRWSLSRDRNTLTIHRELVRAGTSSEGTLVYRREGVLPTSTARSFDSPAASTPAPARDSSLPTLSKRTEPGVPPDITVPIGTHVLLRLTAELNSKHAKEGDHVYLRTDAPVAINGRVVIPSGCNVEGTITHAKPAGHIAGKGELYIRFDSLILPNGVQRDFKARPPREEGAVDGNRKAADGRDVLYGAGMGAGVGAIASGVPGAGIGAGVGALAGILVSRQQNVVLPAGTHLEMVLDRDLVFTPGELLR
jgi:type IV secretion system protein VirB10